MDERRNMIEHRVKDRKDGFDDYEVKVMRALDQRMDRDKVERCMIMKRRVLGGKSFNILHSS